MAFHKRHPLRVVLLVAVGLILLQGCEDDPILEPTGDESGGGSYGKMAPLSSSGPRGSQVPNPEVF